MYVLLLLPLPTTTTCCGLALHAWHPIPGLTMLVCITRVYRHFTYMLLAHVMQFALTGSLLRSGTALVDSRQRPSIDRRARRKAPLHAKKAHWTLDPGIEKRRPLHFCIAFPKTRPPLARLFAQSENPFCDRRREKLPLAFCRDARHALLQSPARSV